MKFITRDTDYAFRALVFMSRILKKKGRQVVTVDEIIDAERLPKVFLRRILQKLAEKNILSSFKGKAGGFSFLVSPEKISLVDIIRIFKGDVDLTHCFIRQKICQNKKTCNVRKKLKAINFLLMKELGKITIKSLSK